MRASAGMLVGRKAKAADLISTFVKAIAKHRHYERQSDPPEL